MLYRRTGARYFDVCALVIVLNGVVVSAFGVVALALYVDLSVSEVDLRRFCRDLLPIYKVPATIAFVETLPRNPSGKLLRTELAGWRHLIRRTEEA